MRSGKKALLMAACAVLLVVASVMGTLAYLTDTESVTNTFTVGKVQIDLNETDVDGKNGTKANEYKLIPGIPQTKDPTVTIEAGSEPSYVFMEVKVENLKELTEVLTGAEYWANDIFLLQNLTDYDVADGWKFMAADGAKVGDQNGTYRFVYNDTPDTLDDKAKTLPALFETITLPGDEFDSTDMEGLGSVVVTVNAYAIQAAGFDTAEAAWTALATQHDLK